MLNGPHKLYDPRISKPTTEEFGFSSGENSEGLASLEAFSGVTRAATRALSRATSQPSSVPTEQQPYQQPQLAEEDSTFCRKGNATEDKEPTNTHSTLLSETVDTQQNSQLLVEKQKLEAMLKPI